jgi:hypothetical protein
VAAFGVGLTLTPGATRSAFYAVLVRGPHNPGLLMIVKLAKALDIPAADLLAGL